MSIPPYGVLDSSAGNRVVQPRGSPARGPEDVSSSPGFRAAADGRAAPLPMEELRPYHRTGASPGHASVSAVTLSRIRQHHS